MRLLVDGDFALAEVVSSPATIRSSVDFPHPLGPTKTMNSPSAISMIDATNRMSIVRVASY